MGEGTAGGAGRRPVSVADGVSPSGPEPPPSRIGSRILIFAVILLAVLAMVALSDGDHAHLARHFLSNLLRQMF